MAATIALKHNFDIANSFSNTPNCSVADWRLTVNGRKALGAELIFPCATAIGFPLTAGSGNLTESDELKRQPGGQP